MSNFMFGLFLAGCAIALFLVGVDFGVMVVAPQVGACR